MIESGELSPVEIVESSLNRIKKLNPALNAYITLMDEGALSDARESERLIKKGVCLGPLHGIIFGIKDNIYVKNVRCTAGSKIMAEYVADYDAAAVTRLREAGAIILGKTNTHEFASGVTGVNPHYGASRNPWDRSRMSGGSSGGSAVSVSTCMSFAALGTETTGSVRIPSGLCGAVGLKPTYGLTSTHGVFPLATSMDTVGAITRSVWDAAAVLQALVWRDSTAGNPPPNYLDEIEKPTKAKVGVPKEYFFDPIDPEVANIFSHFLEQLASAGAMVSEASLKETSKIYESWYPIRYGEAAAIHRDWFRERPDDYGDDVRRMLSQGMTISAVEYIRALRTREDVRKAFLDVLKQVDVIAVPTTIIPAPRIEDSYVEVAGQRLEVYIALGKLTLATSVLGLPGISIPIGLTKDHLPVGAQIVGKPFGDETVLRAAYSYEQSMNGFSSFIPDV